MEKSANVSPAEREKLLHFCRSTTYWSDFGHWQGPGKAPDCFKSEIKENSFTSIIKFPNTPEGDKLSEKWNLEYEKAIRYSGHLATAGVTAFITLTTSGIAGIAAGTIAAIVKDELQAMIPYPRMHRGWSYELTFHNKFYWSAHPWQPTKLVQTTKSISRNADGKIEKEIINKVKYTTNDIPEELMRKIATAPSRRIEGYYGG